MIALKWNREDWEYCEGGWGTCRRVSGLWVLMPAAKRGSERLQGREKQVCKVLQGVLGGLLWWRDAERNLRLSWEWRKTLLFSYLPQPLMASVPSPPKDYQGRLCGRRRRRGQAGTGAGGEPLQQVSLLLLQGIGLAVGIAPQADASSAHPAQLCLWWQEEPAGQTASQVHSPGQPLPAFPSRDR